MHRRAIWHHIETVIIVCSLSATFNAVFTLEALTLMFLLVSTSVFIVVKEKCLWQS